MRSPTRRAYDEPLKQPEEVAHICIDDISEFVPGDSLRINILGAGAVELIGRCGKSYAMSIDDYERLTEKINRKIRLFKIEKLRAKINGDEQKLKTDIDELHRLEALEGDDKRGFHFSC